MKSILLILPYFGKWPIWFQAHIRSIALNPTINWLIPTDCDIPKEYPSNIEFIAISFQEINHKFNKKLGFDVELNYRKFCDLKPTYGYVFEDKLQSYDFWGFCDMDIIWGNMRKYVTDDILDNYDIISSRKEAISGHFNLFRNNDSNKYLYKEVGNYQQLLTTSKLTRFDENLLTDVVSQGNYKVKWDEILCNWEKRGDSHQEYYINKWKWEYGKVLDIKEGREVMYLHFINWKRTFRFSDLILSDCNLFYVSFYKIHKLKASKILVFLNQLRTFFYGYWTEMKIYYFKRRVKSFKKRAKRKLNNVFKK